jgi:hypothetical protein
MLEKVFTKRNCKLNIVFFQFLSRKIPATKKIILECCEQLKGKKNMRPAQLKQLEKLKNKVRKLKVEVVKK